MLCSEGYSLIAFCQKADRFSQPIQAGKSVICFMLPVFRTFRLPSARYFTLKTTFFMAITVSI